MTTDKLERKSRQFWAIDDAHNAVFVTGYECPPNNGVWWVPQLGYSLTEKHHLFATEVDALEKARKQLNDIKQATEKALAKNYERLSEISSVWNIRADVGAF